MHREASPSTPTPCVDLGPCPACTGPRGPIVRHGLRSAPYRGGRIDHAYPEPSRRMAAALRGLSALAGGLVIAAGSYAFLLVLFSAAAS